MKTLFALICLAITSSSSSLTCGAVQIELNADKPVRLYRLMCTQNLKTTYSDRVTITEGGGITEISEYRYTHQFDSTCNDAMNGRGLLHDTQQQDNWDWQGDYSGWTSDLKQQMIWFTDISQSIPTVNAGGIQTSTETYTSSDGSTWGSTSTNSLGWPPIADEHCDVSDLVTMTWSGYLGNSMLWEDNSMENTYRRSAQTTWHLQTGGKSMPRQQNLWCLSAVAQDVINSRQIPPTQISVGGNTLKTNGIVWTTLPDGQDMDVTPQVSGVDFYTFGVGAGKYPLHILAGSYDLSVTNPEFCVGQNVSFDAEWQTPYNSPPPGLLDKTTHWHLPDKFVNESWRNTDLLGFPTGSVNYRANYDRLTNQATSCWFVNGHGGSASIGMNLHFSNGQYVSVAANGNFSVFRPSIYLRPVVPGETDRYYTISDEIPVLGTCKLKLGSNDTESGNGDMRFGVRVNSRFHGFVGLTQLITANYVNPAVRFSDERCDGTEFYNGPNVVPTMLYGFVEMDDGPSSIWMSPNWVNLSCRDFVRFKPDGGIFVTLGIVTWDTVGIAQTFMGDWSIMNDTTSNPNGPDSSDEFPVWIQNQGGMH